MSCHLSLTTHFTMATIRVRHQDAQEFVVNLLKASGVSPSSVIVAQGSSRSRLPRGRFARHQPHPPTSPGSAMAPDPKAEPTTKSPPLSRRRLPLPFSLLPFNTPGKRAQRLASPPPTSPCPPQPPSHPPTASASSPSNRVRASGERQADRERSGAAGRYTGSAGRARRRYGRCCRQQEALNPWLTGLLPTGPRRRM